MSSLRKNFSFFSKDGFSKNLKSLLKDDQNAYLDDAAYNKLMDSFNSPDAKPSRQEVCEKLLDKTSKQTSWSGALRCLLVIHKIIHKLGCQGYDPAFLGNAKSIAHLTSYKTTNSSQESLLHAPHVRYYYTYLQRLSYSYDDFQVCFFPESKVPESILKEGVSFLHFLTRLQNMLRYVMEFLPIFEVSFLKFPKMNLIRQLAHFYLTDCFYFYTYVSQALTPMLADVLSLTESDAISLYEIYSEQLDIAQKLKEIFQLTRYIEEFEIKKPDFGTVSSESLKKIRRHIQSFKQNTPIQRINLLEKQRRDSVHSSSCDHSSESSFSSVKNVAKILSGLVHPNERVDSADNSPVLKSPNPARRKSEGPILRPRIRILKPIDRVPEKEVQLLYEVGSDPNPNLLRVPTTEDTYHTLNESVCLTAGEVGTGCSTQDCSPTVSNVRNVHNVLVNAVQK